MDTTTAVTLLRETITAQLDRPVAIIRAAGVEFIDLPENGYHFVCDLVGLHPARTRINDDYAVWHDLGSLGDRNASPNLLAHDVVNGYIEVPRCTVVISGIACGYVPRPLTQDEVGLILRRLPDEAVITVTAAE